VRAVRAVRAMSERAVKGNGSQQRRLQVTLALTGVSHRRTCCCWQWERFADPGCLVGANLMGGVGRSFGPVVQLHAMT
jgi:hypothetical protein